MLSLVFFLFEVEIPYCVDARCWILAMSSSGLTHRNGCAGLLPSDFKTLQGFLERIASVIGLVPSCLIAAAARSPAKVAGTPFSIRRLLSEGSVLSRASCGGPLATCMCVVVGCPSRT